jgi:tetratricopeptide (TPR) repeat protein
MKQAFAFIGALFCFTIASQGSDTDSKLTAYLTLAKEERWAEAFPLIEEILRLQPKIATSWFNHGVCLDGLSRHKEAAVSFGRAYELKPSDYGAQYRKFRSLALAEDFQSFAIFLEKEGKTMPEIYDLLQEEKSFSKALSSKPVKDLIEKRKKR